MTVEKRNEYIGKSAMGAAFIALLIGGLLAWGGVNSKVNPYLGGVAIVLIIYAVMSLAITNPKQV